MKAHTRLMLVGATLPALVLLGPAGAAATDRGDRPVGILTSPDRSALIVAQGNTGQLWRFDLTDRSVTQVDTGLSDLVKRGRCVVLRGTKLTVVRNFSRVITTMRLNADGSSAGLVSERGSDLTRVLTTAKSLHGRILCVDSKFDEPVATSPYEIITDPFDTRHPAQGR